MGGNTRRFRGRGTTAALLGWLVLAGLILAGCNTGPDFIAARTANRAWSPVYREFDAITFVYVPDGCLYLGRSDGPADEQPTRRACLTNFWISETEVTNAQYAACVAAEACTPPANPVYFDSARYADHPVVHITWDQAAAYARWRGGALPSEAQWEYAARGTEGVDYPWGFSAPDCEHANFGNCAGGTAPVGPEERTAGRSWVGALDLAGSVAEWTGDFYDDRLYGRLEDGAINPTGPESGSLRVLRGGSWGEPPEDIRPTLRARHTAVSHSDQRGFRIILHAPR